MIDQCKTVLIGLIAGIARPSVRLSVTYGLLTKWRRETQVGVNIRRRYVVNSELKTSRSPISQPEITSVGLTNFFSGET